MIKTILIKVLFPKIKEELIDKGLEKIKSKGQKIMASFVLEEFEKNLNEHVLQKYGDQGFYDDLCKALLKNNNLHKLINRGGNRELLDDTSDRELINNIMRDMEIVLYNRSNVISAINYINSIIFISLNNLKDSENIKLKNIIKREHDETRQCIRAIKDDTDKLSSENSAILEKVANVEKLLLSHIENEVSSNLGDLKSSDINAIISEKYNVTLSAKKEQDRFKIVSEIKVDPRTFPTKTFNEYIAFLRFSGKEARFLLSSFKVLDSNDNVIYHCEDKSYDGMCMRLPEVYVKDIPIGQELSNDMQVLITPKFDYEEFQIENENGEIIIPNRKYKIEREYKNNSLLIHLLDTETRHGCKADLRVTVLDLQQFKTTTSILIEQENIEKPSSNLEFFRIIYKLKSAKEIISRRLSDDELIFVSKDIKTENTDLINDISLKISFYTNLLKLERMFGVSFKIPDVIEPDEIINVEKIMEVMDKGVTTIRTGKITINKDGIEFTDKDHIDKMKKTKKFLLLFYYKDITVFDVEIPVSDYFRAVMFASDMIVTDDGDFTMTCQKAYVYNEKMTKLTEMEVVDRFAAGNISIRD